MNQLLQGIANLKLPVKSEQFDPSNVLAMKLATLLVSLREKFHPYTPPPLLYLVPVTTSALVSACFLIIYLLLIMNK